MAGNLRLEADPPVGVALLPVSRKIKASDFSSFFSLCFFADADISFLLLSLLKGFADDIKSR